MAKEKFYSLWGKAKDANGVEHFVTVVGKVEQTKECGTLPVEQTVIDEYDKAHDALLLIDYKKKVRTLKLARSICHPNDTFNFDRGVEIAKKRIEEGDIIGTVSSEDITMLNDDMCNMLVFNETNHTIKNIDKYLP